MKIQGLFLLALAGCGGVAGELDGKSEGDEVRDQSRAVFLEMTLTDSLDGGDGDNTDWKYLDIPEDKGGLRIDVGVDAPEQLKGAEVELFDEFGKRIDRRLVMPNQTSYSFEVEVEKIPNKYFVRFFTREGRSSYSIGARLAPDPDQPKPVQVVQARPPEPEEPEPVEAPVSCPAGMTLKGKRCLCPAGLVKSGSRCVEKKAPPVVAAPETKAPPPVVVEAPKTAAPAPVQVAGKQTVTGSVVRVVPSEDGKSATISIRLDADFNMTKGAQGTLYKSGNEEARFTVTRARGRQALATVNMSTADLTTGGGKLTVKIVGE